MVAGIVVVVDTCSVIKDIGNFEMLEIVVGIVAAEMYL